MIKVPQCTPDDGKKVWETWNNASDFEQTRAMLDDDHARAIRNGKQRSDMLPILHNKGVIYLQFCGWSIDLHKDGTWSWSDTTGG